MAFPSNYPAQRVDFAEQLYGTDRLTRRFVSRNSSWAVEWLHRWDGMKRMMIKFAVARPTEDPRYAVLMRTFGSVDWDPPRWIRGHEGPPLDRIEDFCAKVWRESREMDLSMAAYCASNLWC
jgi:hypothetical protein